MRQSPSQSPSSAYTPSRLQSPIRGSEAGDEADASETVRASRLQEEAALLRKARALARGGRLSAALGVLDASRERFPRSALYQEREALTIELLYDSGQRQLARERARRFLERFPKSPHRQKLRRYAAADSE